MIIFSLQDGCPKWLPCSLPVNTGSVYRPLPCRLRTSAFVKLKRKSKVLRTEIFNSDVDRLGPELYLLIIPDSLYYKIGVHWFVLLHWENCITGCDFVQNVLWPFHYRLSVYHQRTVLRNFQLFMAALRSRCGHYIFVLWFLSSFFPRLNSAVADWMSTILRHMMWS